MWHDLEHGHADIGAQHVHRAVGEIRDAHQTEDQRKARGEQEKQAAEGEAVQGLDDPILHKRTGPEKSGPAFCSQGFTTPGSWRAANRANTPGSSGTLPACRSRTGSRSGRYG